MFKQKEILKKIELQEIKQEEIESLLHKLDNKIDDFKEQCHQLSHQMEILKEKYEEDALDDDRLKRVIKKAMAEYREEMAKSEKKAVKKK
jgi:hypothetical protein